MKQRVLIFLLTVCLPSWATTYYVLAGGTGSHTSTDWANANCKIPDPLSAGDVVYIGNSGGNLADTTTGCPGEASHTFTASGTSGSHITIKAATGADHGTATGWNANYGVDVTPGITWSNSFTPPDGLKNPFWEFCGSYYDIDGNVGTADTTGTYGFYFKSAGRIWAFIMVDSHACSEASLTDISVKHMEGDGVEANGTNGGTQPGGTAVYLGSPVSNTATVQNISLTNSYIHDIFGPISSAGNVINLTVSNDWIYTNFSDAAQHSNGIDTQAPSGGGVGIKNLTVNNTVFRNIQGTAFVICLGGTCDGWKIYNNIFYYTTNWNSICEHGDSTATCGVSKLIGDNCSGSCNPGSGLTNAVIYGNTISAVHLKPGHSGADEAGIVIQLDGSSGNVAQNNFWFNCTAGDIFQNGKIAHDYDTWSSTGTSATTLNTHEFNNGAQSDPFVADAIGNFSLSSETVNPHLNDGVSLSSPYNLDFTGATRGADGTWERGAFDFNTGDPPKPPTGLQALIN